MNALLSGAGGVVSRRLLECLRDRGDSVRVLADGGPVDWLPDDDQLEVVMNSSTEIPSVLADDVDVVYHLPELDPGAAGRRDFVEVNLRATEQLVGACRPGGPRIVFLSDVSVYRPVPWPFTWPISEDAPLQAHGGRVRREYGQSKIDAEHFLRRSHLAGGLQYVTLRPTTVYGPGAPFAEPLVHQLTTRPWSTLARHEGLGPMQWVHVDDLVAACVQAGIRREAVNQTFNIAGLEVFTILDIAAMLLGPASMATASAPPMTPELGLKFSISKACALLGYAPQMTLLGGLAAMVDTMTQAW